MTKTERILKEQVAALEQLVAIKNEVIAELKSVIASRMTYQYLPYPPYTVTSGTTYPPIDQAIGGPGGAGGVSVDPSFTPLTTAGNAVSLVK